VYCGNSTDYLTLDHVDPKGGNGSANLVSSCLECNDRKWDRTLDEWIAARVAQGEAVGVGEGLRCRVQTAIAKPVDMILGRLLEANRTLGKGSFGRLRVSRRAHARASTRGRSAGGGRMTQIDSNVIVNELRALIDKIAGSAAPSATPQPPARTYMTVAEFATFRAVSVTTVKKYVRLGMPVAKVGVRAIRVPVDAANRWLDDGGATGAAVRRAKEEDAGVGRRRERDHVRRGHQRHRREVEGGARRPPAQARSIAAPLWRRRRRTGARSSSSPSAGDSTASRCRCPKLADFAQRGEDERGFSRTRTPDQQRRRFTSRRVASAGARWCCS
jgi:hypothetical protein